MKSRWGLTAECYLLAMEILLATNNPHKAEEIRAILAGIDGLNIITPSELDEPIPDPVEDGMTLEENAWIKAHEICESTGFAVVADDTGLEVAALDGAPGVFSARYAGPDATYQDNCDALLSALSAAEAKDRTARFRTVICFTDGLRVLFAEGVVDGAITPEPRGESGFGYDPLFQPGGSDRTFAEMDPAEKNGISHRGRALRNLRDILAEYTPDAIGS